LKKEIASRQVRLRQAGDGTFDRGAGQLHQWYRDRCQTRIGERGDRQAVHADDGYIVSYTQISLLKRWALAAIPALWHSYAMSAINPATAHTWCRS
jgi:hypothetical protein